MFRMIRWDLMESERETLGISPGYHGMVLRELVAHLGICKELSPLEYFYIATEYEDKINKALRINQ